MEKKWFQVNASKWLSTLLLNPIGKTYLYRSVPKSDYRENLVVTLQYDSINETGKLYINGNEQGRDDGRIIPSNQALWVGHIGGMEPQEAHYFEIMTFNSPFDS